MRARNSYSGQRYRAKMRGITFLLTFDEWYNWWLAQGVDKELQQPPKSSKTLCMCRKGDTGPYSLSNIYCATVSTNVSHQRKNFDNPNQKRIMTPAGEFPSKSAAAEFYGITGWSISGRMKRHPTEYYYL